jgi:hypothetical protein
MNRHTAGVTWQDARALAQTWLEDIGAGTGIGNIILLPDFEDEEDCRFFIPDRSLAFHRMILKAAGRMARPEGWKVVKHLVREKDYRRDLREKNFEDTPEHRANYFNAQARIVPT